ncbi:MAG: extracellular solute-binding protein, partial [Methylobacterium sp.]
RAQAEVARGEPDPAELRRQVARIHDGAVQASQLVSQLLMDATISHRLETPNATGPSELSAVLAEVVGRLDPDLASRVGVHVDPAAADARLDGDRVVLREMLRNLLDNALRYSDGPVSLFVAPARALSGMADAVEIHVFDRGPGIADAEKALVFERFRRGAAAEGRTGSGLGLAIVRRVVAAQGGAIALNDRSGGGLTVCVTLPLAGGRERDRPRTARAGMLALVLAGLALGLLAPTGRAMALDTLYPAPDGSTADLLRVSGTTDTPLFTPLVRAFQATRPSVGVAYEEGDTRPIFERFLAGDGASPDLLMSSASDLQVKLVNDGFARTYDSPFVRALPPWARWRSQVFGVSFEPAVIVYNTQALAADDVPRTHLGFAELLEREPDRFRGRVATYDVATSGVGYMLATQDAAISSYFWRLASAFGRTDAAVSGSSPAILDGLADGRLAIGYNVLGSYAFARQQAGAPIGIVVPDDYVLVLTRTMLIPVKAARPDLAEAFLDFTLSPAGQAVLAGPAALGSVVPGSAGRWTAEHIASLGRGAVQPIALGPSLLVGLDRQRRARFLETWREIVSPR